MGSGASTSGRRNYHTSHQIIFQVCKTAAYTKDGKLYNLHGVQYDLSPLEYYANEVYIMQTTSGGISWIPFKDTKHHFVLFVYQKLAVTIHWVKNSSVYVFIDTNILDAYHVFNQNVQWKDRTTYPMKTLREALF